MAEGLLGTVLLAVDDGEVRASSAACLREVGYLVIETATFAECLQLVTTISDGLLVLAADLPGLSPGAIGRLRAVGLGCPVIVLATREQMSGWSEDLAERPDDYLLEPFSKEELLDRIELQLQRRRMSSRLVTLSGGVVDLDGFVVKRDDEELPLTPMERDLLAYLFANPGRAIERDELLRNVWQYRGGVVSRAVDHAVKRLRVKVEANPKQPVHILTVHGVGYRFEFPSAEVGDPITLLPGDPTITNPSKAPAVFVSTLLGDDDLPAEAGRYTLHSVLGSGGAGRVYRATLHGPAGFEKVLALKIIDCGDEIDSPVRLSVIREARLGGLLKHPNVVDVYDFSVFKNQLVIAMELVNGPTLSQLMAAHGPPPGPVLIEFACQICRGLAHSHELEVLGERIGLVHRDIKPGNILVNSEGVVKITDFGIASAQHVGEDFSNDRLIGTPAYMSPEQVEGQVLDRRSDIFSTGTVLATLALGWNVFRSDSIMSTLYRIAQLEVTLDECGAIAKINARVPGLGELVERCLQLNPDDRYDDIRTLEADLRRLQLHEPGVRPGLQDWVGRSAVPVVAEQADPASAMTQQAPRVDSLLNEASFEVKPEPLHTILAARNHNLPAEVDAFVGRANEMAALAELCETSRLISLLGPGGMGKTRLSQRFAREFLEEARPAGGVWFCDLSDAEDMDQVHELIAPLLALPPAGDLESGQWIKSCGEALARRGPTLLVLDNVEQIAAEVGAALSTWIREAPEARFVVTSRVRLGVQVEQVHVLEPLSREAAVELFCDRARRERAGFATPSSSSNEGQLLDRIVDRLDRMPLAIELAAAMVGMFGLEQLYRRLSDRFRLLRSRSPDRPERHSSLSGVVSWSWGCLEPWEQDCLAQCSVFRGGFFIDSVEEVVDLAAHPEAPWVVLVVETLLAKSLLHTYQVPGMPGRLRVGMYETIREYCRDQLGEGRAAVELRHAQAFAEFAGAVVDPDSGDLLRVDALRELTVELENLVGAVIRAREENLGDLAMTAFLGARTVYLSRGPMKALIDLAEQVDAIDSLSDAFRASLRARLGKAWASAGRSERAVEIMQSAVALSRDAGLLQQQLLCTRDLAAELAQMGRFDDAREQFEEVLTLVEQTFGDPSALWAMTTLAALCEHLGMRDCADRFLARVEALLELSRPGGAYEAATEQFRRQGDRTREGLLLSNLAYLHVARGRKLDARVSLERAVELLAAEHSLKDLAVAMGNLGDVLLDMDELEDARSRLEEARRLCHESGYRLGEGAFMGSLAELERREGALQRSEALLTEGEAIIRESGNQVELGKLLCRRGMLEVALERPSGAASALDEVHAIAQRIGSPPESELGSYIAVLEAEVSA